MYNSEQLGGFEKMRPILMSGEMPPSIDVSGPSHGQTLTGHSRVWLTPTFILMVVLPSAFAAALPPSERDALAKLEDAHRRAQQTAGEISEGSDRRANALLDWLKAATTPVTGNLNDV